MNLDKRVTIENRGESQDNTGQTLETWTPNNPVWASIRPVTGREFYSASGRRAEITHEVIMRHGQTVRARDRIVFNGRVFDVVAPLNVGERNRYTKLMSVEHADIGV